MSELHRFLHGIPSLMDMLFRETLRHCTLMEAFCRSSQENEIVHPLLHEIHEFRQIRQLVISTGQQDDMAGKRLQRLDGRVRIRPLGIVIVGNSRNIPDIFDAVLHSRKLFQNTCHLLRLCTCKQSRQRSRKDGRRKPVSRQRCYDIVKEIARRAGFEERVGCHTMRKTFAWNFYQTSGDLAELQKVLNHSSQEATIHYLGLDQQKIDQTIDRMPTMV